MAAEIPCAERPRWPSVERREQPLGSAAEHTTSRAIESAASCAQEHRVDSWSAHCAVGQKLNSCVDVKCQNFVIVKLAQMPQAPFLRFATYKKMRLVA